MMLIKLKRLFFWLIILLAFQPVYGQSKKAWLYKGDFYFEKNDFGTALHFYQMVLDDTLGVNTEVQPYEVTLTNQKLKKSKSDTTKASPEDYVRHQIAMCYRNAYDYENALNYFKTSAESESFPDDYYYYASSLMSLGRYQEALEAYEKFTTLEGTNDDLLIRALQDMTGCNFALKLQEKQDVMSVELADTSVFNKGTSSFAVSFWGDDKLVFTSAREGGVILDPNQQDSRYYCDLYWTQKEGDSYRKPVNFGRPLNSARHDGSGKFTNYNSIYFTRWSEEDKTQMHIYVAREINMKFFESQKLDERVNIETYQSINPYVTEDGKYLYFSSNKPGGFGGFDIWRIKLDENGNIKGEAENLGKPVNSEFDERAPFFHLLTSTLYFSSDGHETIGGLDIFKSAYNEDLETFLKPENIGTPMNSTFDDSYYVVSADMKQAYLSSNRSLCTECDSIYGLCASCYHIYDVGLPKLKFSISGYVYDAQTNEPIPNARIEFKDVTYTWEHFEIFADSNGYYEHELVPNVEVFLRASKEDYFADKAIVSTLGETESQVYTQDFYLKKIPKGEITIEGIEYDFDSANLRPESKLILDKVVEFLELNHNISIEIRSHTDQRGNDNYNLKLSDRRAKSVVDYLVAHGISKDRLVSKGYGESEPAEVPNENGELVVLTPEYIKSLPTEEQQEEAHQRNRRTAFKVLSQE
ncbi:MAG: OmpA family protein [Putridiphycobacter sp.]